MYAKGNVPYNYAKGNIPYNYAKGNVPYREPIQTYESTCA